MLTTADVSPWIAPANIAPGTFIEVWGSGYAGAAGDDPFDPGAGGGAGGYANATVNLIGGREYGFYVDSSSGSNSTFFKDNVTNVPQAAANSGFGFGAFSSGGGTTGDQVQNGGDGDPGNPATATGAVGGGGGGGGAGAGGDGGVGQPGDASFGGAGGVGQVVGLNNGGAGGDPPSSDGNSSSATMGGGGGAGSGPGSAGAQGAAGLIILTYTLL